MATEIPVICDSCGASYRAPEHLAGQMLKCRNCGAPITVPTLQPELIQEDETLGLEALIAAESDKKQVGENPYEIDSSAVQVNQGGLLGAILEPLRNLLHDIGGEEMLAGGTRKGRDGLSKLLVVVFALLMVGLVGYAVYGSWTAYQADAQAASEAGRTVPAYPFGQAALYAGLGTVLYFALLAPINMLGVSITASLLRLRMEGSLYLNTLGWMSVPALLGAVGFFMSGASGFWAAFIVGLLLTAPALGYLLGFKPVETVIGYATTVVVLVAVLLTANFGAKVLIGDESLASQFSLETQLSKAQQVTEQAETGGIASTITPQARADQETEAAGTTPVAQSEQERLQELQDRVEAANQSPIAKLARAIGGDEAKARSAALVELMDTEPNEDDWIEVGAGIEQALSRDDLSPQETEHAIRTALNWEVANLEPMLLEALPQAQGKALSLIVEALGVRQHPEALALLIPQVGLTPGAQSIVADYGPAAEPAIRAALADMIKNHRTIMIPARRPTNRNVGLPPGFPNRSTSIPTRSITSPADPDQTARRLALVELLQPVAVSDSMEVVRPLARDREASIAELARQIWSSVEPQTYQPIELVISDLQSDQRERRNVGLRTLSGVEPEEDFQLRVNAAMMEYCSHFEPTDDPAPLAEAWGPWRSTSAVMEIKSWLAEGSPKDKRQLAMELLSRWQEPHTARLIHRWLLIEPDFAKIALCRYGNQAETLVLPLTTHDEPHVVDAAIYVMHQIGTSRSLIRLEHLRRSASLDQAASAEAAIMAIKARERQTEQAGISN